ncbi:MAG TPA: ATP-binding protein [Pyrinomonadaceae bacterium]|nr:ATP-binding protein [Pyrinomonadaceae bacterium]
MPSETLNKRGRARRILGRIAPEDFVGRDGALQRITNLAPHGGRGRGMLLLSAPRAGASELLRQAYDRIFQQLADAAPIYFALSRHDRTPVEAARRFLHTFLLQFIAQRRQDPALIDAPPTVQELLELVAPSDYEWVERLSQAYKGARGGDSGGDERAFVRLCLSAPQQAAARGARSVVMFDDLHLAEQLQGTVNFGAEIMRAASYAESPYVLAGLRRRMLDMIEETEERAPFDGMTRLHLERLDNADARTLVERLARSMQVALNEETRDLIVQQFDGNPFFIMSLVRAAQAASVPLTSFRDCQQLYTNELMGGRIQRRLNSLLEEIAPTTAHRRALVRALFEAAANVGGKSPAEAWRRRLNVEDHELQRIVRELHVNELASFNATYVEVGTSLVWRDYLNASYRLEVAAEARSLVVADTLVQSLKRAPQTMARHYRRETSLKLRDLLQRFNFQRVPASLLHYDRFARMYKGISQEELVSGLETETDLVRLPQVVNTASCASFQPSMLHLCDEERCMVAHGFDTTPYTDSSEVIWIAAEIESKLEAGRALTETWCDRLLQLGHACGFERVRLWLVAPEGFSAEASELLNERGAFASSRQQLEFLTARVSPDTSGAGESALDEFEMVIPMGGDTELIAAHTVEQIARRLEFQPEAINQIKTALVEACINASEHSLSPDRKIYQRFRVESDKLVVTVSSRGISVLPPSPLSSELSNGNETNGGTKGRRGWGLKLIRTLMDEVEFERVDDGTRLRMTKYLRK